MLQASHVVVCCEKLFTLSLVFLFVALGIKEGLAQAAFFGLLGMNIVVEVTRNSLWDRLRSFIADPVMVSLFLYLFWCGVTIFLNPYGIGRFRDISKLHLLLVFPLVQWTKSNLLYFFPKSSESSWIQKISWATLLSWSGVAIFGIAQHYYGIHWTSDWSRVDPDRVQIIAPSGGTLYAASGFFYNRIKFAQILVIGLGLPLFFLSSLSVAVFTFPILCVALFFTYSRASFLGAFLGYGLVCVLSIWQTKRIPSYSKYYKSMVAICMGLVGGIIFFRGHFARIFSSFSLQENADRMFLLQRAWEIILDHFWWGVGYGNYPQICSFYYDRVDPSFEMRSQAHQQFLTIWAETGIFGLALWLMFLFLIIKKYSQMWKHSDPFLSRLGLVGLYFCLSHLVIAMGHDPFFQVPVAMALLATWSLVYPLKQAVKVQAIV